MHIEFRTNGWHGEILYDPPPKEIENACPSIVIWVDCHTKHAAEQALEYLVNMVASGRQCIFRGRPEINRDRLFDTDEVRWRGYMRFSFVPGQDKWSDAEPLTRIPLGGLGAM